MARDVLRGSRRLPAERVCRRRMASGGPGRAAGNVLDHRQLHAICDPCRRLSSRSIPARPSRATELRWARLPHSRRGSDLTSSIRTESRRGAWPMMRSSCWWSITVAAKQSTSWCSSSTRRAFHCSGGAAGAAAADVGERRGASAGWRLRHDQHVRSDRPRVVVAVCPRRADRAGMALVAGQWLEPLRRSADVRRQRHYRVARWFRHRLRMGRASDLAARSRRSGGHKRRDGFPAGQFALDCRSGVFCSRGNPRGRRVLFGCEARGDRCPLAFRVGRLDPVSLAFES